MLYKSDHKRDTQSWHGSPRCQGKTNDGFACLSPAVKGTDRCHGHGGLGPVVRPYANKLHERTRAVRAYDQHMRGHKHELDIVILQMERDGAHPEHIARLKGVARGMLKTSQLTPQDLAETYVPPVRKAVPDEQAMDVIHEPPAEPALVQPSGKPEYCNPPSVTRGATRGVAGARAQGAMVGLAIGEALGATQQGKIRDTFSHISEFVGGGQFALKPGQWAGGTAMALALAGSLTHDDSFDKDDFMERLARWQFEGAYSCTGSCVGMCNEVDRALERHRLTAGQEEPSLYGSSNSALVRAAPVAVRYWDDPVTLAGVAKLQSSATHPGPEPVDICVAFTQLVGAAISSMPREDVLRLELGQFISATRITRGSWKNKSRGRILSEDDVVDSLEATLWCVGNSSSFEEAVLLAANLGGDAAAIAAMTGQLAGALYGEWGIPSDWLERVAWRQSIKSATNALFRQS